MGRSIEEEENYWMRAKANAIVSELMENYDSQDVSWKNLISFGDSDAERNALITASKEYLAKERCAKVVSSGLTGEIITKDGHRKRLRSKTVKMLDEPSCEELTAEMHLFVSWLPHVVGKDFGLDVELPGSDDDAALTQLNAQVTGNRRPVNWLKLATDEP